MKLIIDIPDTMIQELKDGCFGVKHNVYELAGCIMNGIPLEDIKAEIKNCINACDELMSGKYPFIESEESLNNRKLSYIQCLDIIDKYRGFGE